VSGVRSEWRRATREGGARVGAKAEMQWLVGGLSESGFAGFPGFLEWGGGNGCWTSVY